MSRLTLCITIAAFATSTAHAAYPERPIRVIVPFAPGGTADLIARIMGEAMSRTLNQQIVVDNRGGAGGALGTQLAARATPDGHTLLLHNVGLAVSETLQPDRGYVALKSLAPVSLAGSTPSVLVVNSSGPYRSVADWVAAARKQPGKIAFGSAGSGSSTHLSMAYLQSVAKISLLHVPYKGGGPAVNAVMSGEAQTTFNVITGTLPHVRSGKLRGLGVSSAKRADVAPEIPTIAESGVPGFEVIAWYNIFAPARTPRPIVNRLNAEIVRILQQPDVRERFQALGVAPLAGSPDDLAKYLKFEVERWAKLIKERGIKLD